MPRAADRADGLLVALGLIENRDDLLVALGLIENRDDLLLENWLIFIAVLPFLGRL